jgi:hypothetical protein
MNPISSFPTKAKRHIRYVLTDIDDTLTVNGRLPAVVFSAMERLQGAGVPVIPITGRPGRLVRPHRPHVAGGRSGGRKWRLLFSIR